MTKEFFKRLGVFAMLFGAFVLGWTLLAANSHAQSGRTVCEKIITADQMEIEATTAGDPKNCYEPEVTMIRDRFNGVMCTKAGAGYSCTAAKPETIELGEEVKFCGAINPTSFTDLNRIVGGGSLWATKGTCTGLPGRLPYRTIEVGMVQGAPVKRLCYHPGTACINLDSLEPANWQQLMKMATAASGSIIEKMLRGLMKPGMPI